jgi:hypothetical protein
MTCWVNLTGRDSLSLEFTRTCDIYVASGQIVRRDLISLLSSHPPNPILPPHKPDQGPTHKYVPHREDLEVGKGGTLGSGRALGRALDKMGGNHGLGSTESNNVDAPIPKVGGHGVGGGTR